MKTKPRGRIHVVQDDNDELTVRDVVLQLDELVNPYRVALFNDLEENLNFHIIENTLVDFDIKKLNDILRTSGYTEVDEEDDSDENNVEIEEEEEEDNSG